MLSSEQVEQYHQEGFIVVEDVFSAAEVAELQSVTDQFIEDSREISEHTEIYDLEPGHSVDDPRVRRIKNPDRHHDVYRAALRHPRVVAALRDLLGDSIKFDEAKLNMKAAGYGSAVEWHQDWAFYPHTNDDLCAVGIMMDDCGVENGPLMVIPGSHNGPIYDHHADGLFCGAIDANNSDVDFSTAVPLLGKAGSISIHHVRAVHGSSPNVSTSMRRLFLLQYRAADAWPLLPAKLYDGKHSFQEVQQEGLVAGSLDVHAPRMTSVPVRLPLPVGQHLGSIFERQRGMKNSYFDRAAAM